MPDPDRMDMNLTYFLVYFSVQGERRELSLSSGIWIWEISALLMYSVWGGKTVLYLALACSVVLKSLLFLRKRTFLAF